MDRNLPESTEKLLENLQDTVIGHGINKTFEVELPRFSSHVMIVAFSKKKKSSTAKIKKKIKKNTYTLFSYFCQYLYFFDYISSSGLL